MCRLFAYAAPGEVTAAGLLGEPACDAFQDLARVHRHGWGSARVTREGSRLRLASSRSAAAGLRDARFTAALHDEPALARLAHLRLSGAFERAERNAQPFFQDGMAFAHNGTAGPAEAFEGLLDARYAASPRGDTDSERYFALVRQEIERHGGIVEGVRAAVRRLRERFPRASFNAMLLTVRELVIVHASATARVTERDFGRLGILPDALPQDHANGCYYQLMMRRLADGTVIFSSTGIDRAGWDELPGETISRVDLRSLTLRHAPLLPVHGERRG